MIFFLYNTYFSKLYFIVISKNILIRYMRLKDNTFYFDYKNKDFKKEKIKTKLKKKTEYLYLKKNK